MTGTAFADVLTGDGGANTLLGGDGSDTLDGAAGNDTMIGGAGSDTHLFGRGGGRDAVDNTPSDAGGDQVQFGSTINFDQLWLTQSDNDLAINIIGSSDTITIAGWYPSSAQQVAAFETADGYELTYDRVDQLLAAMAAFNPPTGPDQNLPPEVRTDLETALAAAWQPHA